MAAGKTNLVGLVLGILLAWISKPAAEAVGLLGTLFVGALKAVAPILVLMLVMASIANHQHGQKTNIRPILFLYLLGTFSAALAAVVFSFAFLLPCTYPVARVIFRRRQALSK